MNLIIYDVEVFKYDWIVVFKNRTTGKVTTFHNDNKGVFDYINDEDIYIGFNTKSYDQYIIKGICGGLDPTELKELSDYIINTQGDYSKPIWEHEPMKGNFYKFNNADIRDDMQQGLSLKAIEGHLGLPIVESSIPFDIDRALTYEEIQEVIEYCRYDVEATDSLVELRKDYLNTKLSLGSKRGLEPKESLSMTNAKLTAKYLNARPVITDDEREYVYPNNLKKEYIPKEVLDFFDRLQDKKIKDDVLFKSKVKLNVGNTPTVIGFGGIHGAIPTYKEIGTDDRVIINADVASFYPNLMIKNNYISRSISRPKDFEEVVDERLIAKANKDTQTANDLKLVVNTTYGAMLNQYNDLYDPLKGRSVCISGQLYLLELALETIEKVPTLKIIQLNTDGIMVSVDTIHQQKFLDICTKWQKEKKFELEFDYISSIYQKDVNNYIEVDDKGKLKTKGGYLVKGVSPVGAFNVNNNYPIVSKAIVNYFTKGIEVEETINECLDIFQFQIIAKIGSMYSKVYHEVNGELVEQEQKVNRVYSTKDKSLGKLYKYKPEIDQLSKIASLPENCIIDNKNNLSIEDVDKKFYIDLAKKQINDFIGKKKEKKKMATKTTTQTKPKEVELNVYQKLILARKMFLDENIKKSGKNMGIGFKYFELKDIIPTATEIFNELGIITVLNIKDNKAVMRVINTSDQTDDVYFSIPFVQVESNKATNPIQALGSSITYLKRYLYLNVLDIIEADEIEPTLTEEQPKSKKPLNEVERKEIVNEMTESKGNATKEELKQLKDLLRELRAKTKSEHINVINSFATETDGFKSGDSERVKEMISDIKGLLND